MVQCVDIATYGIYVIHHQLCEDNIPPANLQTHYDLLHMNILEQHYDTF